MIPFSRPGLLNKARAYIDQAMSSGRIAGNHEFGRKCEAELDRVLGRKGSLLTTSCTHALELSALLADIQPGDEVILPSFTFSSTATAFVLRGARLVFVDIDPRTMNIDVQAAAQAVSAKTCAIVAVHYAGVACDMDALTQLCADRKLTLIEDAAQALFCSYKGKALGTFGRLGCFSFHESKNVVCGEGGALWCANEADVLRAEILREKGTDRAQFFRGAVDKYSWRDTGSSWVMSDLLAAVLLSQLEHGQQLCDRRLDLWKLYYGGLKDLADANRIELPFVPAGAVHNGHIFYLKCRDLTERSKLIEHLKSQQIMPAFHYIPLHSSPAGMKYGEFRGTDRHTTRESERLLRVPMYYDLTGAEVAKIVESVHSFYKR